MRTGPLRGHSGRPFHWGQKQTPARPWWRPSSRGRPRTACRHRAQAPSLAGRELFNLVRCYHFRFGPGRLPLCPPSSPSPSGRGSSSEFHFGAARVTPGGPSFYRLATAGLAISTATAFALPVYARTAQPGTNLSSRCTSATHLSITTATDTSVFAGVAQLIAFSPSDPYAPWSDLNRLRRS
jgi:hypothetical protein